MNPPNPSKQDKQQAEQQEGGSGKKHDYQTNMPVGEILRRAREHFGQSLADVENAIRIRASQIDAIEKSQYDKLPGRVYAIGFVRSYSEYLGFDGDKMVALFKSQSAGGGRIKPELNFPAPASESRMPPLGLVIAGLALFISFMIVWASEDKADPEDAAAIPAMTASAPAEPAASVSAEISEESSVAAPAASDSASPAIPLKAGEQAAAVAAQTAPEETPSPEAEETAETVAPETESVTAESAGEESPAADAQQEGITLNVKENSWVEIKDQSGKAIVSRMLKAGDQYFVPNRPDLTMSLGNAGGIEVVMDGKTLPPLGRKGEVRRNISLDTKSLKALASPR